MGRRSESTPDGSVIVIAPPDVAVRIIAKRRCHVVTFEDVNDFERWRAGHAAPRTVAVDVDQALEQVGVRPEHLHRVLPLLQCLRRRHRVPHLKELVALCSSARTFYRAWADEMPEAPSDFLDRVRANHARHLLQRGVLRTQAWREAGYSSPARMDRALENGSK